MLPQFPPHPVRFFGVCEERAIIQQPRLVRSPTELHRRGLVELDQPAAHIERQDHVDRTFDDAVVQRLGLPEQCLGRFVTFNFLKQAGIRLFRHLGAQLFPFELLPCTQVRNRKLDSGFPVEDAQGHPNFHLAQRHSTQRATQHEFPTRCFRALTRQDQILPHHPLVFLTETLFHLQPIQVIFPPHFEHLYRGRICIPHLAIYGEKQPDRTRFHEQPEPFFCFEEVAFCALAVCDAVHEQNVAPVAFTGMDEPFEKEGSALSRSRLDFARTVPVVTQLQPANIARFEPRLKWVA